MISDERAEKACEFIRDNADELGRLSAAVKSADHEMKVLRAIRFSESSGTVAEREAEGWISNALRERVEAYKNQVADLETLRTRIKAAELTFECWRTQQANLRKGA